jgi:DNA-binding GntR family transcriptional regulator
MSERASERYVRIGFGLLDPDPSKLGRRRRAHQLLVDEFRKRDPEPAARALNEHLPHRRGAGPHRAVRICGPVAPMSVS